MNLFEFHRGSLFDEICDWQKQGKNYPEKDKQKGYSEVDLSNSGMNVD